MTLPVKKSDKKNTKAKIRIVLSTWEIEEIAPSYSYLSPQLAIHIAYRTGWQEVEHCSIETAINSRVTFPATASVKTSTVFFSLVEIGCSFRKMLSDVQSSSATRDMWGWWWVVSRAGGWLSHDNSGRLPLESQWNQYCSLFSLVNMSVHDISKITRCTKMYIQRVASQHWRNERHNIINKWSSLFYSYLG